MELKKTSRLCSSETTKSFSVKKFSYHEAKK